MPQPEHFPGLPVVVGPEWLTEHYGEVLVADVRWYLDGRSGRDAHLGGHLPGAVFVDLDADLAAPATEEGGRHPLPDPEAFARALGALGIGDDTPVVGYDDAGGSTAARLVWMLRALGSPAAVLDGGIQAWPGVLEQGPVPTAPRHRTPAPWPAERVADTSAVRAATADGARLLLDARAHGRYTGAEPSPVDVRPGHIPGARSAAWQDNLGPDGRFAAPERLRERFAGLGAAEAGSVTAYCGSGVTACHDLLALEHAGFTGARLYPGSWSAWAADPGLPAETGETGEAGGGGDSGADSAG
ncbi:thiosulfate/3-mercaptopyruvate sulfurtransferase [Spinactinospora alkalitolerans]|uniref:Thiosulfate/3-mercaptopyruvate sulfurtransferase n=1 Tax=Spinactinospora alkalitolerans TaxID=687207 RepID=A0A852TRL1_9ACTN|nr:sulfurtransferase [Spinactinospora alkalitolerans]NYE45333.1 thiosulfate/3-mercaptopyruvate sulfurtransferase [Spinactinospora alkalitolerans]